MSRPIKFRVWVKNRKGYRELDQLVFDNQGIEEVWVFPKDGEIQQVYNPLDVVIEQYAGLKDKNGKEIYEGDIILMNQNVRYYVDFEFGGFWLNNDSRTIKGYRPFTHLVGWGDAEVIGNIHENPELLEGIRDGES